MHEPADFLHARFCGGGDEGPLCGIVAYHDDGLSHGLFFAGLMGIDAVLLLAQAATTSGGVNLAGRDRAPRVRQRLGGGVAIGANLSFEAIGADLVVVAVATLALFLVRLHGPRALTTYFGWAYLVDLARAIKAV